MGFDYKRGKEHAGQDSMWTSYSDLFLGLSIIFLLLYVTASLKQGTDGIRQQQDNQRLVKESEDLKQQIKVYETLKQDYLKNQASNDEQATYEELMGKLTLLQEKAKDEKDDLRRQAQDNEKKEQALNKYQQLIRNIINSNMIAKSRIKSRDNMIDDKEEVITEKTKEISSLETSVTEKEQAVKQGEAQIGGLKAQLDKRMKQLRESYKAHRISKTKFEQQQAAIKVESDKRIKILASANANTRRELEEASRELKQTSSKLNQAEGTVTKLEGEIEQADGRHKAQLAAMKGDFEKQKAGERAAFERELTKAKLSGAERAAREAKFKAEAEGKARDLAGKIAELDQKYKSSQGALAKANENLNARRNAANRIKKSFEKIGVKAEVDAQTGDVMLSFGDQYFETGRADLKPRMQQILTQAMPAYSASLFEDQKIAEKIQSVEIVGFASPTYKGKYVDPTSLEQSDRQAVNYNLDLSYSRARSIFNYVFDKDKMTFKHQQRLLPLVKVTGRSFLATDAERQPAANSSAEGFCRKNDCAKLQRVIIKFTLKD
jgi:outer membrane protein OmpA-like peptidoglycan-associated protein